MIGLVLAGGQSTRLGTDKTTLLHAGQSLPQRAAMLLLRHCQPVYFSCHESQKMTLPVLVDDTPRIGPVGGIITALKTFAQPIFVLACDLPFLEERFISDLLIAHASRPLDSVMTTWALENSEYIESLVAIYEPSALPFLETGVREGIFKLSRLIPAPLRHCLIYTHAERQFFFNINFPADLKRLRQA